MGKEVRRIGYREITFGILELSTSDVSTWPQCDIVVQPVSVIFFSWPLDWQSRTTENADFSIVLTVSRVWPYLEFGAEAEVLTLDISTDM